MTLARIVRLAWGYLFSVVVIGPAVVFGMLAAGEEPSTSVAWAMFGAVVVALVCVVALELAGDRSTRT